jgi:hypothetical protein
MSSFFDVLNGALSAMQKGPRPLPRALAASAEINGYDATAYTAALLVQYLSEASPGDSTAGAFRSHLARWDNAAGADWTSDTEQNCEERRQLIYRLLALGPESAGSRLCAERQNSQLHRCDR